MAALFSTLGALLFGLDIGYISGVENMQGFADDVNNGSTIDPESLGYVRARVRTRVRLRRTNALKNERTNERPSVQAGGLACSTHLTDQSPSTNVGRAAQPTRCCVINFQRTTNFLFATARYSIKGVSFWPNE